MRKHSPSALSRGTCPVLPLIFKRFGRHSHRQSKHYLEIAIITVLLATVSTLASEPSVRARHPARRLNLPEKPYSYSAQVIPQHVQQAAKRFDNTPKDNPITNHGATLGRVLFYDKTLSANGTTSCASCHQQRLAFSDGVKVSRGFDGGKVARNSMSLVNVRYYASGKMFWDERARTLEQQVLMPIENEIEMGHSLEKLIPQLAADPIYRPLFRNAFGDETVSQERVAKALSQFVRSIVSFDSKYDRGRMLVDSVHDSFPNFTDEENLGKQQFFGRGRCAECHLESGLADDRRTRRVVDAYETSGQRRVQHETQSAFFYAFLPTVNGVDSDEGKVDSGLVSHTKKEGDFGRFKVSSLRNIAVTGPYMHDGRFHTLDQVLEHYNWSVRPHRNLDARLEDFAANGMALPEREKVALARFLETLTDKRLLKDKRFSDPFQ